MYNILFICYGNICRSPMAEMIFKDLIYKNNKRYMFTCTSRATSMEEIGNDIYPMARTELISNNVTIEKHRATQVTKKDMEDANYIIVMEDRNRRDLMRMFGDSYRDKIHLMTEYTDGKDIEDPWYTGEFKKVFIQIDEGCKALFNYLVNKENSDEI